jgi:hypothetical protein
MALAVAVGVLAFSIGLRRPNEPTPRPTPSIPPEPPVANEAPPAPTSTGISLAELPPVASARASATPPPALTAAAPTAKLVAIAEEPQAATGDLGGAMREAVGPRPSADVAVAEPTAGGPAKQLKPSPGAVVGTINTVMPAARLCLGDSEVVRNATIVFRSDGTVARVDIAGTPNVADECIRDALAKARTMPFVEDTFAARATVRP